MSILNYVLVTMPDSLTGKKLHKKIFAFEGMTGYWRYRLVIKYSGSMIKETMNSSTQWVVKLEF